VQLRDACGSPLGAAGAGFGSSLQAQLTSTSNPAVSVAATVTDNGDGT
jgi:hypothetical protein